MKKLGLALVLSGMMPSLAFAQIAVLDAIGQTQRMQQINEAVQQVDQLKQQVENGELQLDNISGISGLANLLPHELDQLAQTLPSEWEDVYFELMQDRELSGQAGHIFQRDQDAIASRDNREAGEYVQQQRNQQYAVDEAMATEGYDGQLQRIEDLKTAVRALNNSSTAKEVMDLNTRMQVTQATIEVERNKYMLADMLSRANQRRLEVQERQVQRRQLYGDGSDDNSTPAFPSLGGN